MDELYDIVLINKVIEYNKQRFDAYIMGAYFEEIPEYEKILHARYQKNARIKQHLVYLCSRFSYIWFCTFTFKNEYIDKCTRTKRDLVKDVLKAHDLKYILNVDYGKQNDREHYHCIVATNDNIDINSIFQSEYKGGFSLSIPCKQGIDDLQRLSKYINKLVNHCIKATTNKQRIVYNFKAYDDIIYNTAYNRRIAYLIDYYKLMSRRNDLVS